MENKKTHFGYKSVDENEKKTLVGDVFDSVAKRYDVMNDVMSLGIHRYWKDYLLWQVDVQPGEIYLDLAAGTGDIAKRIAKKLQGQGQLILADINESMLLRGRERMIEAGYVGHVHYVICDAECLPFQDGSIDCITMAFGLRNVTHKEQALREIARVLKPGGRVYILEFSKPENAFFSKVYDWYSFAFLPKMGKLIARDEESYQYLAESIRMHPEQDALLAMMEEAGLSRCCYQNLTNGVVAIHEGFKA